MSSIAIDLDGAPTTLEAALGAAARARPRRPPHAPRKPSPPGSSPGCARARSCSTRSLRQGRRRPAAALRQLDREPQPRERGRRRVGAGARRRGAGSLLHPAAVVRVEGPPPRPRPDRRLRPHGVGRRRRGADRLGTAQGPRARRVRVVLRRARRHRTAVLRRRLDRRAGPAREAPGRVLRVHGAVAPPLRVVELDLSPARRAHARARARPRSARVPRARAGRLPPVHAADAGRDRVGVRRDGHVRAPPRGGRPIRTNGSRCSRRTSKTRSPRCSARSR